MRDAKPLSIAEAKKKFVEDGMIQHRMGGVAAFSQVRKAGKTFLEIYTFIEDDVMGTLRLITKYDGKRLKVMNVSIIEAGEDGEPVDYERTDIPLEHLKSITKTWRMQPSHIGPAINELAYALGLVTDYSSNLVRVRGSHYGTKIKPSSRLVLGWVTSK
jgi:hypothetical protein